LLAERQHQHRCALRSGQLAGAAVLGLAGRERRHHAGEVLLRGRALVFFAFGICGGHGFPAQAALSCIQLRRMETVSFGFLSASSPTFCTDWACTWPWTWAMSIILA